MLEYFAPDFLSDYPYWNIGPLADSNNWGPTSDMQAFEQARCWKYREEHQGGNIIITAPCSSVLDVAWLFSASNCLNCWDSAISIYQWEGRGQFRRTWSSPVGNIYAALFCPLEKKVPFITLPVIIGLCLVKSFAELGVSLSLKWPNDLMLNRHKIGGILTEAKKEKVFAGIGINLNRIPRIFTGKNRGVLAVQNSENPLDSVNPASYWQRLVQRVVLWYELLVANKDLQSIAAQVERVMEFRGEQVRISSGGELFTARILGVDNCLGLRIEKKGREEVLYNASLI